jgi:Ran GTPase-activating protein (RanGAP) involved in mRNA processing and transport
LARLSGLQALDISENISLGDAEAVALAQGALHDLTELRLERTNITDEGALALIHSPKLSQLQRLGLARTSIGARTVEQMCRTARFFRCGELCLHDCQGGGKMIAAVARSPHATLLRSLTASESACTDATALELARSPHLKGLVKLCLVRGQIGPDGAEALTDGSLPHLEELTLRGNPIGDRGALTLARFLQAKGAPSLYLGDTGLTAEGIAALVGSSCLAGLHSLRLYANPIGDAGVAVLAGSPDLASLHELWLNDVTMTDAGGRALLDSPHLPPELRLYTHGNALSSETEAALRERFRRP